MLIPCVKGTLTIEGCLGTSLGTSRNDVSTFFGSIPTRGYGGGAPQNQPWRAYGW